MKRVSITVKQEKNTNTAKYPGDIFRYEIIRTTNCVKPLGSFLSEYDLEEILSDVSINVNVIS